MANNATVNWRKMKAGFALDLAIAALLGWTEFQDEQSWKDEPECGYNEFKVVTGIDPETKTRRWLPRFSDDLNVAWLLFDWLPHEYTPRLVRMLQPRGDHMATICKASIIDTEKREELYEEADTPALAVCRVWLAFRERLDK